MGKVSFVRNATVTAATPATLVQSKSQTFISGNTYTLTFDSDVQVGDTIIVAVVNEELTPDAASITDSDNNNYNLVTQGQLGFCNYSVAVAVASVTGPLTVTVEFTNASLCEVLIHEFANALSNEELSYCVAVTDSNIPPANPVAITGLVPITSQSLVFSFITTDDTSTFAGDTPTQTNLETQTNGAFSSGTLYSIATGTSALSLNLTSSSEAGTAQVAASVTIPIPQADLTLSFAENNGGDTLAVIFAATSSDADFPAGPSTITDSNGNTYTLQSSNINALTPVTNVYTGLYLYVCQKCVASSGTVTMNVPGDVITPGNLNVWAAGIEFHAAFAEINFDVASYDGGSGADSFTLNQVQTGTDNVTLTGIFDSGLNTFSVGTVTNPPNTGTTQRTIAIAESSPVTDSSGLFGLFETLEANEEYAMSIIDATDTFGFAVSFVGTNNVGGSAAETLTFSLNKGPDPIVPIEGRAIATVQIDCTQQQSHLFGPPIDYPEFSNYGDKTQQPTSFIVIEFDLEHLFQGSGLSEMRTLMAWSRPTFQSNSGTPPREDVAALNADQFFPALLTNTTTLQTIVLGGTIPNGTDDTENGQYGFGESLIIPMPANKHSLKYRFICPQPDVSSFGPQGKFTLQFCNWDIPPIVTIGVIAFSGD